MAEYHLQYRRGGAQWLTYDVINITSGAQEPTSYSRTVTGVVPLRSYEFRLALARSDDGKVGVPFPGPSTGLVKACSGEYVMSSKGLWDWPLIKGRGAATKWENRRSEIFCAPPQDPLLKSGNFTRPPYNMAKTSSYSVKTTPKLFVPPFRMAKTFSSPLFVGVKLHVPPPPVF